MDPIATFSGNQGIVAYCDRLCCVLSRDAVVALRVRGFKAWWLEEGFPEWEAAGLAVEAA